MLPQASVTLSPATISIMEHKIKKPLKIFLIALFWFGIWEIASLIIGRPLFFPSPIDVCIRLSELIFSRESDFIINILCSLGRVGLGIVIAIVSGFLTAVLCSFWQVAYEVLYPLVSVIKSTPVASFIILLWIFIGNNATPVVISALMVFPIVFSNIYQGMKSVDTGLLEVCKIYKISKKKTVKSLYIPTVTPYFTSALLSSIGLGWKAGIAAEVLCTPIRSIGKAIFESKLYFEYVDLFAWTAAVIILSLIFEVLLTKLLKKLLSKYSNRLGGTDENK